MNADDQAGTVERPGSDVPAPHEMQRHAPHHANAGDAVGEEESEEPLVVPVDVHVPQARYQVLAARIDHAG